MEEASARQDSVFLGLPSFPVSRLWGALGLPSIRHPSHCRTDPHHGICTVRWGESAALERCPGNPAAQIRADLQSTPAKVDQMWPTSAKCVPRETPGADLLDEGDSGHGAANKGQDRPDDCRAMRLGAGGRVPQCGRTLVDGRPSDAPPQERTRFGRGHRALGKRRWDNCCDAVAVVVNFVVIRSSRLPHGRRGLGGWL